MKTINCKGSLIDLTVPGVMGIINCTPDSFYDGGKTIAKREIVSRAAQMVADGATYIDIGGYSSRPGAEEVSETDEMKRVIPAVEQITKAFPEIAISIDTFRSGVAKAAVEAGACMVNDISGGSLDKKMFETIAPLNVPYILMHIRGTPQTMARKTQYEDIITDILKYFSERIAMARAAGINDIIVDPGFGFAKTRDQNFELLANLEMFQELGVPLLVGVSRKSMIYKTIEVSAEEALNGTTALHSIALWKGASILRVHDVKEAVQCVQLLQKLKKEA